MVGEPDHQLMYYTRNIFRRMLSALRSERKATCTDARACARMLALRRGSDATWHFAQRLSQFRYNQRISIKSISKFD